MPRFAANLSMMFTEVPFLERFQAAADAGFSAVEYLFPYEHDAAEIAQMLRSTGLSQALFNAPPGDWGSGERGLASLPGREDEFSDSLDAALRYAQALDCPRIHVMAGIPSAQETDSEALYVRRIQQAADQAADHGTDILIEPINPIDMPGYFLSSVRQALPLLERIARDNVGLQLDLYHAQITDGDITRLIQRTAGVTKHVQIASVPDRHEPDTGELDYRYVLNALDSTGYRGWVGCEYHPAEDTLRGLGWLTDDARSCGSEGQTVS